MGFVNFVGWVTIGIIVVIFIALLYMIPLYYLWNWLMPTLFGITKITLWQSLGILLLTGILFKNYSDNKMKY